MDLPSLVVRACIASTKFLLLAPWLLLAVVSAALRRFWGRLRELRPLPRHGVCPQGHAIRLHGVWSCRCGATFAGHAFQACPVCGEEAGWTACDCGLTIRNHHLT